MGCSDASIPVLTGSLRAPSQTLSPSSGDERDLGLPKCLLKLIASDVELVYRDVYPSLILCTR